MLASVQFAHPQQGRISLARYEYDGKGRLSAAYDALGHADRYEYDGKGRMSREIAKDGGIFSFRYDDEGRCIRTWGLDGYDLKILRYRDNSRTTEVVNGYGAASLYQWNALGQVLLEIRPSGGQIESEFDVFGRLVRKKEAGGGEWRFGYDDRGDRVTIVDPLGRETKETFNGNHQPLTQTTPGGFVFKREYDARNRLSKTEDPAGGGWKFAYDTDGNLVRVDMGKRTVEWLYASEGELIGSRDPEGNETRLKMDAFGRLAEKKTPLGGVYRYRYDLLGRQIELIRPDGSTVTNARDAAGNVVEASGSDGFRLRNTYGPCRRLLAVTRSNGETTRLVWGREPDQLLAVINPSGEEYRFEYDAEGNKVSIRDFSGVERRYAYDPDGNLVSARNGDGATIQFTRDAARRLLRIAGDAASAVRFEYDDSDYMTAAETPDARIEYARDPLGRPLREESGDFWIERGYDSEGFPQRAASSLGLDLEYGFDGRGLLTGVSTGGRELLSFTRNAMGAEIRRRLPGGLLQLQDVDAVGRLWKQSVRNGAADDSRVPALIEREYSWNGEMVTGIRDRQWGETRYVYDSMEQLVQEITRGIAAGFAYDAFGNLLSPKGAPEAATSEIGPGSRLLRMGGYRFEYDTQGRMIRKILPEDFIPLSRPEGIGEAAWTYEWDALSQLRKATAPDGRAWEYGYDAQGRRAWKSGPEGRVRYFWNGNALLHAQSETGEATSWIHDFHTLKPLALEAKGKWMAVITDHLGTPREVVSGSDVVWSAEMGPWGDVREERGEKGLCPVRFQGHWHDAETGLHFNRSRYYDPALGRYLSPDAYGLWGGMNPYRYCPNPINWIDPLGLDWNYVLVDANDTPYYSGVSTQDPSQVEKRHRDNVGADGPRLDPHKGDRLIPITPVDKTSSNHETARGLEQRVLADTPTIQVIGRTGSDANPDGNVRGNLQNPVSPDADNAESRAKAADDFLTKEGKTVKELIDEGIKKKNAEEEAAGGGGCKK